MALQASLGRSRPRIWWCPTGHFAHLPIHAAGADGIQCSDYVVSSYTPTLGALISARAAFATVKKDEVKALVAAVPHSDLLQWDDLPSTTAEARAVEAAIPTGALLAFPRTEYASAASDQATAGALLASLAEANMLHLACHGYQDAENPLLSGFVMRDEILTIERLMPVPLPRAFMAFLSACETAKGDKVSFGVGLLALRAGADLRTRRAESARPGGPPCGRDALRRV
jgi:CHAT domain-containing protein